MPGDRARHEVVPYTDDNLVRILAEAAVADRAFVDKKLHRNYLQGYLRELGAQTLIVEREYVDHDYLLDYTAYYARCFREYRRHCTRLHVFSAALDPADIDAFLQDGAAVSASGDPIDLQRSYLGFIVVKPLPQTLIGRTCLRPYASDQGRRLYPVTRPCIAHLFGQTLVVHSLAFQEQDQAVAACATSALWSAFHATAALFHHKLLSPSEITRLATDSESRTGRSFPSDGLTSNQMSRAVREIGLEPDLLDITDAESLKLLVYAYLRCGIPLVLGLALYDTSDHNARRGFHAVTIAGFSTSGKLDAAGSQTLWSAACVDKLYAHDDQLGPFSRIVVGPTRQLGAARGCDLEISWAGRDGKPGSMRGLATTLLVPLDSKVRISFTQMQTEVARFDGILQALRDAAGATTRLRWDIELTLGTTVQGQVAAASHTYGGRRKALLTTGLPRFVWRVYAYADTTRMMDLVFDATDLPQGEMLTEVIEFDDTLRSLLGIVATHPPYRGIFDERRWRAALLTRLGL